MRTFEQLSSTERERALQVSRTAIVEGIVYGVLEIKLTVPTSQNKLDWILDESRKNEEPRLAMLRIFGNKPIINEINKLALVAASETMYDGNGDRVLEENLQ